MLTVFALTAALLAQGRQTDTTVTVSTGTRLHAGVFGGSITVGTWSRNAVRVTADHGSRDRVTVRLSDGVVTVEATGRYGPPASVDFEITVPEWMAVSLEGVNTDLSVKGTKAPVSAETVQGDVTVDGGAEQITLTSVSGDVHVTGARGRVNINATNQDITLRDIVGDITAEAVNGAITMERVESANVEANTVNGDVLYDGTIKDGGHYRLATHSGDVAVSVDENTNATVSVATFSGEFDSADFPVRLSEVRKGRRFSFTLGKGAGAGVGVGRGNSGASAAASASVSTVSARIDLESFDGTISLRRPGTGRARHQNHKDKDF